jgi:sulfoxide reductase heme-binding subunit YedZ
MFRRPSLSGDPQVPLRRPEGAGPTIVGMEEHLFWIASRAAGIAALLLSSAAVGVGLTMGGRMVKGRGLDLRAAHEALSLATLLALVVHAVTLLGDSFLKPGIADLTIPFASGYKEPWMSLGIIAGWSLVALGVSYYFRTRIGVARWKRLHRFTALAWLAGIVHSLGTGTDAGQAWFLVATGLAVVPALVLLVVRHLPSAPRTRSAST